MITNLDADKLKQLEDIIEQSTHAIKNKVEKHNLIIAAMLTHKPANSVIIMRRTEGILGSE